MRVLYDGYISRVDDRWRRRVEYLVDLCLRIRECILTREIVGYI